ncbi:non-ribosomal peptide synthetase [Xanthomonas sacchari]|uniref:Non-ribosomal peptide synthetase n=1 Tax=Xanthomonas sacchari TaxID=56458 RepID=A0A2P5YYF0_9XANT|nr:non-ribosomal peptide synthetase [Xanthomonas sacchari]MDV0440742.1 non-ribosomal peptide synthetase [Xanthomonas sacchari]PPU79633.1 non-ribosomal peptide synthetase [Xanthomonas sacchari]
MSADQSQTLQHLRRAVALQQLRQRGDAPQAPAATETIPSADRQAALPLSWAQQRLWFLDQLDHAASAGYHMPAALRLRGILDRAALRASLDRIVARHESLRTTFASTDGTPRQVIAPANSGFTLHEHDLRMLDADAQQAEVARLGSDEALVPFDLTSGPLIRGRLLQTADDAYVLLVTQHHIICDGWSIGVLVQEVSVLYAALSQGRPDPLPPLPIQYADYAAWQRQCLQGDALQRQLAFWTAHLRGAPALLTLPTDRPRPAAQSYNGDRVEVRLSMELTAALRALAQRHGATLFMTLLTGWSALLSRLSGQDDVVVGSPVANRQRSELEPLIGFFVNTLALRVDLSADPSVAALLAQVKATTLDAYAHRDLPFEQVVEALQPERSLDHSPVFQAMLALNNTPRGGDLQLPGLALSALPTVRQSAQFDIALSLSDDPDHGLSGSAIYATDLFDRATVERMLGYWMTLLTAMAADDSQSVGRLPLLDSHARAQLLAASTAITTAVPASPMLAHALFEGQAAARPEALALHFDGQCFSYAALNRRANQVAHLLRTLGVRPDDRVAICMERGVELLVGVLATLKAGGAYVPLDPAYPMERLAYMLGDSAPVVLLTQARLVDELPAVGLLRTLVLDPDGDDAALIARQPDENLDAGAVGLVPTHLAYVIYTSGSTGLPKGVMVEHRSLCHLAAAQAALFDVGAQSQVLQFASISFDASIFEIVMAWSAGACLHVASREALRPGPALLGTLRQRRISHATLPPSALMAFAAEDLADADMTLVVAGEAFPPKACQWAGGNRVFNAYGPTETTVWATAYRCMPQDRSASVPIGRPIANTSVYLLGRDGEPVPLGVVGEIHIGGAGVARGYLNRPELTEERFLRDPFADTPGARMYRTGDLGRWRPDGTIDYVGRNDLQIKVRGFRIEPGEIEARLIACAGVREAAVIDRADAAGGSALVAYVVPQEGAVLEALPLRDQLRRGLPDYMIPSAFVTLPALPLTPNGKLDRKALPAPDQTAVASRRYEAPVGDVEQTVAAIWQELLALERVGRHDHFFELGGHSLLVISLIERLHQAGLEVQVRTVFDAPTLSALAARLHRGEGGASPRQAIANPITAQTTRLTPALLPLVQLSQDAIDRIVAGVTGGVSNIQDIYPLAPLQEGILFHHLLGGAGDTYQLRLTLAFDDQARMRSFLELLQVVIDRHDILRTAVFWEDLQQPVQVVHRQAPLRIVELTTGAEAPALAQLLAQTDPQRLQLDLRQAPMLAAYVAYDASSGDWLVALLSHHMVCDHIGLDLVFSEVQQLLQGHGERLPTPMPYRNFIAQTHALPDTEHETYFREQFGDVEAPTAPFGILAAREHGVAQQESSLPFDDALSRRIRDAARASGVTPAVLFHVAWAQVLAECSGSDDVVFGTVLSGRMQGSEGADRVVGMFINSLPIRLPLAALSVTEAVRDTYARLTALLAHEQAPLALAQRFSRVPSHLPLFTALLNYRYNQGSGSTQSSAFDPAGWDGIRLLARSKTHGSYPLTMSVEDWGQALGLSVLCVPEIDGERLIRYFETTIRALVDAMANAPSTPVRHLSVLPAAEVAHMLAVGRGESTAPAQRGLVHEAFEAQAQRAPDATALIFGDSLLSYDVLNRRANQLAHHLRSLGVKPDARVAICMERGIDMVVALLAVLKAGGGYVPLDPAYPAERLADILRSDPPLALLTVSAVEDNLPALSLLRVVVIDDDAAIVRQPQHDPEPAAIGLTEDHLAYVLYTSGSTGRPKGVMVTHRNVGTYLAHAHGAYLHDDVCGAVVATPLGFDATVTTLLAPWRVGKPVVLLPEDRKHCLAEVLRYCLRPEPWLFKLTPAHLDVLAGLNNAPTVSTRHRLVVGGEQLSVRTLHRFRERVLPHAIVVNEYGPTEATVGCTTFVSDGQGQDVLHEGVPIGRPIADAHIYVLSTSGMPVPAGVAGELHIGGAGVARGYLNRPALTAERFLPDPFASEPDARLYRTGDLVRWLPDGNLQFLGRNDFQVKIRGFRIELGEIEAKLVACTGVEDAVVVAQTDGSGDARLVAYVVAADEGELQATALRATLLRSLPDYMVPGAFVTLAALPLTPNGKLDRKALPAPDQDALASQDYQAPIGEAESTIAAIWQELLDLERVGRHDHFFELGGHSLLAVRLVTRLRTTLGVDVTLRDVFAQPTPALLAGSIASAATTPQAGIVPVDREGAMPLSWAQQRLWFLDQLDHAAGAAYHIPAALRFSGALNRAALRASLDRIVARHENLRTTFVSVEGEPQQVIAPAESGFLLIEHDLRHLQGAEQEAAVAELSMGEARAPFDLAHGPLVRGRLLVLAEQEHVLLVTQHHIVSDGWSIGVLVREFSALYTAFHRGLTDPLPSLSIQYADYAAWQRQWLQGDVLQEQIDFWRHHLSGAPALLELPTDRPRPAVMSYAGDSVPVRVPRDLSRALHALAQRHGVTLFMTLLAGWAVLLSRLSGQHQVVIGSPVANRQRTEIEPLIGFFVNTLAFRVDLRDDPSVAALLAQVKATTLDAYAHQELPFEQVVEALQPERSLSHNAVFQAALSLNNTPGDDGLDRLPDLKLSAVEGTQRNARFDLSLSMTETESGLVGGVVYATDLFERDTVQRMLGHWVTLLQAMVADDAKTVSSLPLLTPAERTQLVDQFSPGPVRAQPRLLIHTAFEACAAAQPEAVAVEFAGQQLSYAELNGHANRIAHRLIALGLAPDDRVALFAERSLATFAGILGILKAGGAYVPLDPSYPAERVAYMLADSKPVAVLSSSALQSRLPLLHTLDVPVLALDAERDAASVQHAADPRVDGLTPRHLAYVIYTSGSTGQPKGVMVEHASVMNLHSELERAIFFGLDAQARVGLNASLSFDASIKSLLQLLSGRCVVLLPQDVRLDALALLDFLGCHRLDALDCTPVQLEALLAEGLLDQTTYRPKVIMIGGEPIPASIWRRLNGDQRTRFFNVYGPTECTVDSSLALINGSGDRPQIGRPLGNVRIYLLDPQRQPVPVGAAGELYIGGAGVARGYLDRPELTAQRFLADPFVDAADARMYRTGDLGRWLPDGTIEYLGRNDFQVKIRGFRIELGEIEARLATCAGVREAAVVAREDAMGETRLVAYLVPHAGHTCASAALRERLLQELPEYMVPAAFVTLDAFPLTPNGKLDRQALPAPDQEAVASRPYEAPIGEAEQAIATIWEELLGLERVGRHDHFFELGGHSLLAVRVVVRLKEALQVEMDLRDVFMSPQLSALAALIVERQLAQFDQVELLDMLASIDEPPAAP